MDNLQKNKVVWIIAVLILGVLLIAWYMLQEDEIQLKVPQDDKIEEEETAQEEIYITRQENVYGIGGTIIEVNENESEITVETATLPSSSVPLGEERWIWTVSIDKDSTIVTALANEDIDETSSPDEHFSGSPGSIEDLHVGARVSLISKDDIAEQFSLPTKHMRALRIEVYPL